MASKSIIHIQRVDVFLKGTFILFTQWLINKSVDEPQWVYYYEMLLSTNIHGCIYLKKGLYSSFIRGIDSILFFFFCQFVSVNTMNLYRKWWKKVRLIKYIIKLILFDRFFFVKNPPDLLYVDTLLIPNNWFHTCTNM